MPHRVKRAERHVAVLRSRVRSLASMPPSRLVTLPVRSVVRTTPRAALLTLSVEHGAYPFVPGQAVRLGLHGGAVRKPYSIASSPADVCTRGVLEFLVGVGTDDLAAHGFDLSVGVFVDVEGPFGSLVLPAPVDASDVLLVAGGTGVAPLRSMWRHLLADTVGPRVTLVYSARTGHDVAFASEIAELVGRGLLRALVTLTREAEARQPWRTGRINVDLLRSVVAGARTLACVCGPRGFVVDLTAALLECGLPLERILNEGW